MVGVHWAHGKCPQAPPHPPAFLAKLSSPELTLGSHKFPPRHSPHPQRNLCPADQGIFLIKILSLKCAG